MKSILKDVAMVFMLKVLAAGLGFFSVIIITRLSVSTEVTGYYFFALSLLAVVSTLARGGSDSVVTRFISMANKGNELAKLFDTLRFLKQYVVRTTVFFMFVIALVTTALWQWQLAAFEICLAMFLVVALLPLVNVAMVYTQYFQGIKKMFKFSLLNNLPKYLLFILLIISVQLFPVFELSHLLGIYVLAVALCFIFALFAFSKQKNEVLTAPDINLLSTHDNAELISRCRTMWGVSVLAIFMGNGAQIILGFYNMPQEVALLAVANRVAMVISFLLLAFNSVLSPRFAELSKELFLMDNKRELQIIYRKSTRLMVLLTLPLFMIVFIYAEEIMALFGNEYLAGQAVLQITVAAYLVKVLVGSVGQLLIMTGFEHYQRQSIAVATLVLAALLIMLIPFYGALGAAVSVFFAILVNNLLGLYYVYKKLNISLFTLKG